MTDTSDEAGGAIPGLVTRETAVFAAALRPSRALLGVDAGTRTLGLALSDGSRTIASAVKTIRRGRFAKDAAELLALAEDSDVTGIVIGYPLNLDGSEGPRAQATRALARNLSRLTPLPILLFDERLSTVAAERVLIEADMSRARRAEVIDKVAAAIILQTALDALKVLGSGQPDA